MRPARGTTQQGQAIVLVALILVVLIGFLGLAIDGGRGYADRRHLQASVDAGALAAAYTWVNTTSYSAAENEAVEIFASNQRLYLAPSCSGIGSMSATCSFGDETGMALDITVTSASLAGTSFTLTARHSIPVTIMQVLGGGQSMQIGASATAVGRKPSGNALAIQTLSPAGCPGRGTSFGVSGDSSSIIIGDIWANGAITVNGASSTANVTGNVVDVCPPIPPPLPNFTVSGEELNGWALADPAFASPPLDTTGRSWPRQDPTVVHIGGTYGSDPSIEGGAGCYFLAGGVYTFAQGLTVRGGFVSNELKAPDEPLLTSTTSALSGTISSIPVVALGASVPGGSILTVAGQAFTVSASGAAAGSTAIPVEGRPVAGTIGVGTTVVTMATSPHQFWDSNGVNCGGSFQPWPSGAGANPPLPAGTYGVVVTAVQWAPQGVPSCAGPASASCLPRETPPSACRLVDVGAGEVLNVWVSNVPGAMEYRVYVSNGSCAGPFGYAGRVVNSAVEQNRTVSDCAPQLARNQQPPDTLRCDLGTAARVFSGSGWSPDFGTRPPEQEGPPLGPGLPNADAGPLTAVPPAGDRANENQCVNGAGVRVTCPVRLNAAYITPGAVLLYLPGAASCVAALAMNGGGDLYLFSGQQYRRILLFEPGRAQSATPNTCANTVNGGGLTSLIGILYLPAAGMTITGTSRYQSTITGGIITWTATINGNGNVAITGDPSLRALQGWVALTQ